jgi:hypothetical protein
MQHTDPLYGPHTITEPVLLDLLESQAIRRLQGVLQHGITALLGITQPITRYEHSVGAMLLVRRLGGCVTEQVAALLHDVSHTAFSHVIDYVFGTHGADSYHERKKREYLGRSDLPDILARYGLDWHEFLSDEQFPLLEQPSPRLCADRLDYFLRDARALGILTEQEVHDTFSRSLVVAEGRMAVCSLESARLLADRYLATDEASWSNPGMLLLYELTARAVRAGLEQGVLAEEDLWGVDAQLWEKLCQSRAETVARYVALLTRRPDFVVDDVSPTVRIRRKVRTLDPDVLTEHGLLPLSAIDSRFAQRRSDYLRSRPADLALRLLE